MRLRTDGPLAVLHLFRSYIVRTDHIPSKYAIVSRPFCSGDTGSLPLPSRASLSKVFLWTRHIRFSFWRCTWFRSLYVCLVLCIIKSQICSLLPAVRIVSMSGTLCLQLFFTSQTLLLLCLHICSQAFSIPRLFPSSFLTFLSLSRYPAALCVSLIPIPLSNIL